jgi:hypothetical protein
MVAKIIYQHFQTPINIFSIKSSLQKKHNTQIFPDMMSRSNKLIKQHHQKMEAEVKACYTTSSKTVKVTNNQDRSHLFLLFSIYHLISKQNPFKPSNSI